jgi:hypothetical protein
MSWHDEAEREAIIKTWLRGVDWMLRTAVLVGSA